MEAAHIDKTKSFINGRLTDEFSLNELAEYVSHLEKRINTAYPRQA